jgi:hypothetical protein
MHNDMAVLVEPESQIYQAGNIPVPTHRHNRSPSGFSDRGGYNNQVLSDSGISTLDNIPQAPGNGSDPYISHHHRPSIGFSGRGGYNDHNLPESSSQDKSSGIATYNPPSDEAEKIKALNDVESVHRTREPHSPPHVDPQNESKNYVSTPAASAHSSNFHQWNEPTGGFSGRGNYSASVADVEGLTSVYSNEPSSAPLMHSHYRSRSQGFEGRGGYNLIDPDEGHNASDHMALTTPHQSHNLDSSVSLAVRGAHIEYQRPAFADDGAAEPTSAPLPHHRAHSHGYEGRGGYNLSYVKDDTSNLHPVQSPQFQLTSAPISAPVSLNESPGLFPSQHYKSHSLRNREISSAALLEGSRDTHSRRDRSPKSLHKRSVSACSARKEMSNVGPHNSTSGDDKGSKIYSTSSSSSQSPSHVNPGSLTPVIAHTLHHRMPVRISNHRHHRSFEGRGGYNLSASAILGTDSNHGSFELGIASGNALDKDQIGSMHKRHRSSSGVRHHRSLSSGSKCSGFMKRGAYNSPPPT